MRIILIILFLIISTTSYAETFYRRVLPLNLTINGADAIIVNYDFSAKKSIRCTSTHVTKIEFDYKGRKKQASLPIILQSTVPALQEFNHELADVSGQFILTSLKNDKHQNVQIVCDYAQ